MQKTLPAYAKINLYLDIIGKRSNGYHDICGIMQQISLCDNVTVRWEPTEQSSTIVVVCDSADIPSGPKNIAYRAAEKFLEYIDMPSKTEIFIEKNIPSPAGMAGGSSDAAAVLKILNDLSGAKLTESELIGIGGQIGADVPFCIAGGAKITGGTGDILEICTGLPECIIVSAVKGDGVPTPWAFGELDKKFGDFSERRTSGQRLDSLISALGRSDLSGACENMFNVFEEVILPIHSGASEIALVLKECGALSALMSGSGPSVFGIFSENDACKAKEAVMRLEMAGAKAFVCRPI